MKKYLFAFFILSFLVTLEIFTQEKKIQKDPNEIFVPEYRGVRIGMNWNEVLKVLKSDSLLEIQFESYFGDFDFFYPIIKSQKKPYINEIYYQFTSLVEEESYKKNLLETDLEKWNLYAITITFNPTYINYLSLYKKLKKKYGPSNFVRNRQVEWVFKKEKETYSLTLDKKSEIMIMNTSVLEKRREDNQIRRQNLRESHKKKIKEELLKDFLP